MPILALTDIAVRALKPGLYMDRRTPAFGIRVGKNRKTWIVLKEPNRTKVRLGHYPELALSEARRRALITLGSPFVPKENSVSVDEAKRVFLEENYRGKKERTKFEATRLLNRLAFKGTMSEIDDLSIERELGKLAHVPSEQLHAFRALRTFLRWSTKPPYRFLKHSPLEGYSPPSEDRKGTRVLTDPELRKIWHACEGQFGTIIRVLILWGTRNGETARMMRDWREDDVLTIPGTFTKNGRAHAIPLLRIATTLLDELPDYGPCFFPSRYDTDTFFNDGSWGKLKKELDQRSGVRKWQVRDIRRTARSGWAKLGISREISEILLNHVTGAGKNDLDEIYNKYHYLPEKRAALGLWEAHLSALVE